MSNYYQPAPISTRTESVVPGQPLSVDGWNIHPVDATLMSVLIGLTFYIGLSYGGKRK